MSERTLADADGRARRSEYGRPETVEDTAYLVTEAGGTGGLVVEVTDGTAADNDQRYRIDAVHVLAKIARARGPSGRPGSPPLERRVDLVGLPADTTGYR